MKKLKRILFLFLVLVVFNSCAGYQKKELTAVDQTVILYSQQKKTVSFKKIQEEAKKAWSLTEFCREYQLYSYKTLANGTYIVLNTTEGYVVVWFDSEGNNPRVQNISFSSAENYNALSNIQLGMPLDSVKKADPTGQYDFLLASWSEYPKISYHFFESGNCYVVFYDEDYNVKDFHAFTI